MPEDETRLTIPNIIFGSPDRCTYCGETPSALDHVIPVSQYKSTRKKSGGGWERGVRTYACTQCNSILGDKYFTTFAERVLHVRNRLEEKASTRRSEATWTDEEIAELSGSLQRFVASKQFENRQWDRRTSWALSRRFYENLEDLARCSVMQPDNPKYCEWLYDYFDSILV